jgi:hypothetical protein
VPAGNLVRAQGLTADECAAVEFLSIGAHAVRRGVVTSRDKSWSSAPARSVSASRCLRACQAAALPCSTAMRNELPQLSPWRE